MHKQIEDKKAPLKPCSPLPHQQSAIKSAQEYFVDGNNSRGKLIMPCGTGKSLLGYWIAKELKAKTVMVAVPSLALIRQTLEVWTRESVADKRNIRWIAVCSDESISELSSDDVAVFTQDLGVRVHTDPQEIAGWLKQDSGGSTVVFTTYQSGKAISEAARGAGVVFDVGIIDEAHKTVGKADSLFSHLLYDNNVSIGKRVFMTATERRYRGRSEQIASMDDYGLYGEVFELLSFIVARTGNFFFVSFNA